MNGQFEQATQCSYSVTSIMSADGGSCVKSVLPRGDRSWDSWLLGLPGAGARCFPNVCVSVCAAPKFLPHYPHCLRRRPESTKEDLKPLPLTLRAARVPCSPVWQANMSTLPTGAGCAGQDTSLPSVFIHIWRPYSLLIVLPWRPLGLSLRLVYTDVYLPRGCKCRGGSSRQLTPGKPEESHPGCSWHYHLKWSIFNGACRNISLDERHGCSLSYLYALNGKQNHEHEPIL